MKIFMLCEFYSPAVEFQENLLVKYYRMHGHEVTVVASTFDSIFDYYNDRHDPGRPRMEFEDHGARIVRLPYRYNLLNRLRAYTSIEALLHEVGPDLIFIHDIMPNIPELVRYMKTHPHCRMILDYHADYSNSGKNWLSLKVLHGMLRKHFLDKARPHLSRIFPVVPASATFLTEVYGVPPDEMEILPLGADMDLVRRIRAEGGRDVQRRELGFGPDELVIFTGGKLTPGRRTEILFEAVARLDRKDVKVLVVGDSGAEDLSYRNLLHSAASGRTDIVFTGWLQPEDIYRRMMVADLAVFPARQSILWQQAIAMGLPLIAGDVGSQDISYLNLAENIIVLKRDEIRADRLAAAILSVVDSRERMARMSAGARRVADEHLDWSRLIERTLRFNA